MGLFDVFKRKREEKELQKKEQFLQDISKSPIFMEDTGNLGDLINRAEEDNLTELVLNKFEKDGVISYKINKADEILTEQEHNLYISAGYCGDISISCNGNYTKVEETFSGEKVNKAKNEHFL
jgi:hypothetical protein